MAKQPMSERTKLRLAAGRVRKRIRLGKSISEEQKAILDQWEAMKGPRGRPQKPVPPVEPAPKPEPAAPAPAAESPPRSSLDQTATAEPSVVERVLTPPPPPRVLSSSGVVSSSDWRAKYGGDEISREMACTMSADAWIGILKKLNEQIEESERTPFLSDEFLGGQLRNACVLTVDNLLPAKFEVTPQVIAACGTTVVVTQRAYVAWTAGKKKPAIAREPEKETPTPKELDRREQAPDEQDRRESVIDANYELGDKDVI
jgi:hypothetical protein